MISVVFQQEIDEEFWNQLQDELKKTVAVRESEYISIVGEYESKQLWIICSIDDSENEEDLIESILEMISSFGYAVLVGVGQVFEGMEKVPASWLASMDNLYRKDEVVGLRDFEYQYTKFGTIVASNASVIQMRKLLISAKVEMRGFCLLRLCPNPRRTLKVCSGNAGNFQRLRDFANR